MNEKKVQKAGDNSQQLQANTIIVNSGIEEKRAREIFMEMFGVARKDLTNEAYALATQRVKEFENNLIPKMMKIEDSMKAFSDPSFQFLLTEASKTAAATEREADYSLLSELLIHRVQNGSNRNMRAGISRAVEIVDEISDDALLGLTVAFAIEKLLPTMGSISEGLDILDNVFKKLCYGLLPVNIEWLEHLDILDAVRVSSFSSLKKIEEYYSERMSGYCVVGIKQGSENHKKAIEILRASDISENVLVNNELNREYVRLDVVNESTIDLISIVRIIRGIPINIKLTENQKQGLHEIYQMYDNDKSVKKEMKSRFNDELIKRPYINKIREWWNGIPNSFHLTEVGRVLAHSNAKRCDGSLPPLG